MTTKDIKVCIGRWEWLPADWEGINGLYSKPGPVIVKEALRHEKMDAYKWSGVYTLAEFEEEVNGYDPAKRKPLSFSKYWIKVLNKNRKVV